MNKRRLRCKILFILMAVISWIMALLGIVEYVNIATPNVWDGVAVIIDIAIATIWMTLAFTYNLES